MKAAVQHLDWCTFLDARMEVMHLETELGISNAVTGIGKRPASLFISMSGSVSHGDTASGKLKGPALKLVKRKLAAAKKQVTHLVADARARAVRLDTPRNLVEFTLASFSDDEVTLRQPLASSPSSMGGLGGKIMPPPARSMRILHCL